MKLSAAQAALLDYYATPYGYRGEEFPVARHLVKKVREALEARGLVETVEAPGKGWPDPFPTAKGWEVLGLPPKTPAQITGAAQEPPVDGRGPLGGHALPVFPETARTPFTFRLSPKEREALNAAALAAARSPADLLRFWITQGGPR